VLSCACMIRSDLSRYRATLLMMGKQTHPGPHTQSRTDNTFINTLIARAALSSASSQDRSCLIAASAAGRVRVFIRLTRALPTAGPVSRDRSLVAPAASELGALPRGLPRGIGKLNGHCILVRAELCCLCLHIYKYIHSNRLREFRVSVPSAT
jgi:hypothetical protein